MNAMARRYGTSINFNVANIARLPFADETFDYVYSISVLEHMAKGEDVMAVKEMSRVLKKGGTMLVTVDFSPVKMERKAYTKEETLEFIAASGLEFDNVYDFDVDSPINRDPTNFYDVVHYRPNVGNLIIERIEDNGDYGDLLNDLNSFSNNTLK